MGRHDRPSQPSERELRLGCLAVLGAGLVLGPILLMIVVPSVGHRLMLALTLWAR